MNAQQHQEKNMDYLHKRKTVLRKRHLKGLILLSSTVLTFYIFFQSMKWTSDLDDNAANVLRSHLKKHPELHSMDQAYPDQPVSNLDDFYEPVLSAKELKGLEGVEVLKRGDYSAVTYPPFVAYGPKWSPGDRGRPYYFKGGALDFKSKRKQQMDFIIHYFDDWISREIALHRTLLDVRDHVCKSITYTDIPSASVIIVFHNEAWSTLLRSIHSVIDRTQVHLLKEIILVDDKSTMEHLQKPLEKYVQKMDQVRLIRATTRMGLIKARNLGSQYARGDVLIFIDSHVECFEGWYEPLVDPISKNIRTVTFPIIDMIDPKTFEVMLQTDSSIVGSVNIQSLQFTWIDRGRKDDSALTRESPVMPGGIYAVSRKWFHKLGMYDPALEFWGGENIEMSFKTWMCGGTILVSTCSHVGHVFREKTPIKWHRPVFLFNSVRVAEVWMDQYKHFFYEKHAYNLGEPGGLSKRQELRRSLKCHSFNWYLENVHPELKADIDENSIYAGQVKNIVYNHCLEMEDKKVHLSPCMLGLYSQVWILRTDGILLCYDSLLAVNRTNTNDTVVYSVQMVETKNMWEPGATFENQVWEYDQSHRLVHKESGRCLSVTFTATSLQVVMTECVDGEASEWMLQTRKKMQQLYKQSERVSIDWTV